MPERKTPAVRPFQPTKSFIETRAMEMLLSQRTSPNIANPPTPNNNTESLTSSRSKSNGSSFSSTGSLVDQLAATEESLTESELLSVSSIPSNPPVPSIPSKAPKPVSVFSISDFMRNIQAPAAAPLVTQNPLHPLPTPTQNPILSSKQKSVVSNVQPFSQSAHENQQNQQLLRDNTESHNSQEPVTTIEDDTYAHSEPLPQEVLVDEDDISQYSNGSDGDKSREGSDSSGLPPMGVDHSFESYVSDTLHTSTHDNNSTSHISNGGEHSEENSVYSEERTPVSSPYDQLQDSTEYDTQYDAVYKPQHTEEYAEPTTSTLSVSSVHTPPLSFVTNDSNTISTLLLPTNTIPTHTSNSVLHTLSTSSADILHTTNSADVAFSYSSDILHTTESNDILHTTSSDALYNTYNTTILRTSSDDILHTASADVTYAEYDSDFDISDVMQSRDSVFRVDNPMYRPTTVVREAVKEVVAVDKEVPVVVEYVNETALRDPAPPAISDEVVNSLVSVPIPSKVQLEPDVSATASTGTSTSLSPVPDELAVEPTPTPLHSISSLLSLPLPEPQPLLTPERPLTAEMPPPTGAPLVPEPTVPTVLSPEVVEPVLDDVALEVKLVEEEPVVVYDRNVNDNTSSSVLSSRSQSPPPPPPLLTTPVPAPVPAPTTLLVPPPLPLPTSPVPLPLSPARYLPSQELPAQLDCDSTDFDVDIDVGTGGSVGGGSSGYVDGITSSGVSGGGSGGDISNSDNNEELQCVNIHIPGQADTTTPALSINTLHTTLSTSTTPTHTTTTTTPTTARARGRHLSPGKVRGSTIAATATPTMSVPVADSGRVDRYRNKSTVRGSSGTSGSVSGVHSTSKINAGSSVDVIKTASTSPSTTTITLPTVPVTSPTTTNTFTTTTTPTPNIRTIPIPTTMYEELDLLVQYKSTLLLQTQLVDKILQQKRALAEAHSPDPQHTLRLQISTDITTEMLQKTIAETASLSAVLFGTPQPSLQSTIVAASCVNRTTPITTNTTNAINTNTTNTPERTASRGVATTRTTTNNATTTSSNNMRTWNNNTNPVVTTPPRILSNTYTHGPHATPLRTTTRTPNSTSTATPNTTNVRTTRPPSPMHTVIGGSRADSIRRNSAGGIIPSPLSIVKRAGSVNRSGVKSVTKSSAGSGSSSGSRDGNNNIVTNAIDSTHDTTTDPDKLLEPDYSESLIHTSPITPIHLTATTINTNTNNTTRSTLFPTSPLHDSFRRNAALVNSMLGNIDNYCTCCRTKLIDMDTHKNTKLKHSGCKTCIHRK